MSADPDTLASPGEPPRAIAERWIAEIDAAERDSEEWVRRGKKIIDLYKDKRGNKSATGRRFNILWSNVETIGPAIYARTPQAVVSRRFKDADPVGRQASEVLERALNYALEEYDFDEKMILVRKDYLLPGRGSVWIRYEPTFETVEPKEDGEETYEALTYERVACDHVAWNDFLTNPAREWSEVRWVGRRVYLSREELRKRFHQVADQIPLDFGPKGDAKDQQLRKAQIYEIWDKPSKTAFWISKGYSEAPLDTRPDPLNLTDFYPCPRPVFATLGPDSLIPVPDYALYQDQAEEVNELTARIGKLTDALKLVGFYAGDEKAVLQQVFEPGKENTLIPIESWAAFAERGGVKGLIEWVPIAAVVEALRACIETRRQVIEDLYQITGISDIIRGESDPVETATAAKLKGQWGSLRVRERQRELARFARDIIRIKGEVIAEKFGIDTLRNMTGVQMLTNDEKALAVKQYQMATTQARLSGQPVPPPPEELTQPTWEDVKDLLADNAMRQFRVEIETDSTIEPDDAEQKAAATEFVTAIGTLIMNAGPMVQIAPPLGKLVAESVKFLARRYRIGREMEETIDQVMDEIGQMPPAQPEGQPQSDPMAGQVAQTELQTEQIKQQGQLQGKQMDAQMLQAQLPIKAGELQLKAAIAQRDPVPQVVG